VLLFSQKIELLIYKSEILKHLLTVYAFILNSAVTVTLVYMRSPKI